MAAGSEASSSDTLVPPSEEDPWTATVWDNLRVYAQQLSTVGGAAAIAKTTVAPLERIKVSNTPFTSQQNSLWCFCKS